MCCAYRVPCSGRSSTLATESAVPEGARLTKIGLPRLVLLDKANFIRMPHRRLRSVGSDKVVQEEEMATKFFRGIRFTLICILLTVTTLVVQVCSSSGPRPTRTPTPESACAPRTVQDFWRAVRRRNENAALDYIHPSLRGHADPWCEVCGFALGADLYAVGCEIIFHAKDIKLTLQSVRVVEQYEDEAYLEAAVRVEFQNIVREFAIRHHVVVDGRCYLTKP